MVHCAYIQKMILAQAVCKTVSLPIQDETLLLCFYHNCPPSLPATGAKVQAEAAAEVDRQRLAAEQEADRQRVVAEQEAERQRLASEVEAAAAAQPAEGTPEQAPELVSV